MKIKIKGNPITPFGSFNNGQILDSIQYPEAFLLHLVNDANTAEQIDYETKVNDDYKAKKKPLSTRSLQQDKASPKKTRSSRNRKPKS